MFKNHLVVALCHLRRRRGHAALNVGGLALPTVSYHAVLADPAGALRYE